MTLKELAEKYKITEEEIAEVEKANAALVQAEKDRGISESRKKNKEAVEAKTAFGQLKDYLKNLGVDPEGDLEAQAAAIKEKVSKAEQTPVKDDAMESFKRETKNMIDGLKKTIEEKERAAKEAETKFRNSKTSEILSKHMADTFIGHDLIIEKFIRDGKVKLADDNTTVLFVEGDEELDLAKGLESFKKTRSDLVRNVQAAGSGGSGGGRVDYKKAKEISESQFNGLSLDEQKNFRLNGGKVKVPQTIE